jgi:hypothetical protein
MTSNKTIHPGLIRAYREAKYVVGMDSPIVLRIGQVNRQLKILLETRKVTTAAFITAFNPYSEVLNDEQNQAAQNSLIEDIQKLGLAVINGYGQDMAEEWPRESSVLALGITESLAEGLADKYGQNGFLWIGSLDAFPALRLRYPIGLPTSGDFAQWLSGLSSNLNVVAKGLSSLDQAWLMSVSAAEQAHWLDPNSWDLNKPWPLAKPDGSAMGIGTELDRVFKLIAAGQSQIIR